MRATKLLTIILLSFLANHTQTWAQCSLITKNGSFQDPKTVCTPVDFTMNVWYKFLIPVDTSLVEIIFVWNDGTGATTTKKGIWNANRDSVWAEASHIYPPTDECSRSAESFLVFNGDLCTSSGRQEQTFSTWGTDEENSGVLNTDPVVAYFCEGENIVDFTFDDNSTFNCNISIEPDNPNRYYRWVQFIYNTYTLGGDRIPNVTVHDSLSINHSMTDNSGNFVSTFAGPIIRIPIPVDGPNQTSYPISAPAGGVAGDIFEITLRNWNVCNPYDNLPTDGIPPSDLVDGDNPPIVKTARIEIIASPPVIVSSLFEFCTSENILLNASAGGAEIRWYADSNLSILLHVGPIYNPQLPPFNLDNTIPGNYTFYITSREGICESAPNKVRLEIYQSPEAVFAGNDQIVCADSIQLNASVPTIGSGLWTTTGSATIVNITLPDTWVKNLPPGSNLFRWTVSNGPCNAYDEVNIISDRQPDPAFAGTDNNFCDADNISLNANIPTQQGIGHWIVIQGTGYLSDTASSNAQYISPSVGSNLLIWQIASHYGACPVTIDTVAYFVDFSAGNAAAGPDSRLCQSNSMNMNANFPLNGGSGEWSILTGSSVLNDINDPLTTVNNLSAGSNRFVWTLSSIYGLCPSSTDTVNIIRDLSPGIAEAGFDKSLCLQYSDTLQANDPSIGTGLWQVISNPSGTPPVFIPNINSSGAIISIFPGNEGMYTLRWTLQNGTCISRDTVNIDFGIPPPPANAGPDNIICGPSIILQGNHFSQGTGTWTQLSGSGSSVFLPNEHADNALVTIPVGSEGVYLFEWRLSSGACAPSADTVKITFLTLPGIPIVMGDESCGPDSLTLSAIGSGGNAIVQWYNAISDPFPFQAGESFNTPLLFSTTNYYVDSYDTITGCKSLKQIVTAAINPVPAKPGLIGDTLCGSDIAVIFGNYNLPANTIRWSQDKAGLVLLAEGSSYSQYLSATSCFWARALDTIHGCLSQPDSVWAIVYPSIPEPLTLSDSACGPSDFVLHSIKSSAGHFLRWYNSPIDNTIIFIGDSMYIPVADTTRTYWVSEWNDSTGCISPRVKVEAIIHQLPGIPLLNDTSSCGPKRFTLRPSGDSNTSTFRWYNLPIGGILIQESDSLVTGLLSSNTSYWVSGYNSMSHCEGQRTQVDIAIYPVPAPITILGPTVVLKDQTGVIFATNGLPGSNFYWTIPSGITLDQNMNDFVRLSFPNTGSFILSVYEITINDCVGNPVSHPVTVTNDSIAIDIGLYNQNACTGVDFEIKPYLFGGTPPYTYSWTGDIVYLSNTNTLFTTFSPAGTGIYKLFLEVIDVNLRTAHDSVLLSVFTSPTANIITKDAIVCVGNTLQLTVQTTGYNAVSHLWSGPVQNLSSYTVKEPVYTPYQPDTVIYYYQLTDVNGCKAYDSTRIYSDIPTAYFEILTAPGCSPLQVTFNNQSQRAILNSWDFGDGSGSTATNPIHLFKNQDVEIKYYPVKLKVTSALACKDSITKYAMVWPNPEATLDAIQDKTCSPVNTTLFSTPANIRYYWDFGDGETLVTSSFNIAHIYETENFKDTTYTVKVITESSLHCIDSAFLSLTVFANPEADFTIIPPFDTFPNRTFSIDNTTLGDRWDYNWKLGDGRQMDIPEPGSVEYESPGNYSVTLVAESAHCIDSISKTIYLYPAHPVAKFAGIEPGCMPHTINLINASVYAESFLWEFGDGSISTAENPSYTYYQPGIYKIKLTVKGAGGESSFSDTARVYILPNSFFDLAPRYVYVNDEPVNFFNLSDNADVFEWDFGDSTTSIELNPKHVYKKEGTYDITLKVWTDNNCFDLYVMENAVLVEPSGVVEFPNAFRPASPIEENREFKPGIIDHVANYHLMIFNRWGELIFESFDQETGWDGTYKGAPAKQDVYIWIVKGTYSDGKGFTKTGDVTLMN